MSKYQNTKPVSASKTHQALRREIALSREVIRGSVVIMNRSCGKASCRCVRGHKHRSMYLSRSSGGKTTLLYIPRELEDTLSEAAGRYRRIRDLLDDLSEANLKKLIAWKKGR